MGMSIDKPRHYHPMPGVNNLALVGDQALDLAAPADSFETIATNKHRTIFDDGKLTEITAGAGTLRPRQGHEL
jgi:hypothetical protein